MIDLEKLEAVLRPALEGRGINLTQYKAYRTDSNTAYLCLEDYPESMRTTMMQRNFHFHIKEDGEVSNWEALHRLVNILTEDQRAQVMEVMGEVLIVQQFEGV